MIQEKSTSHKVYKQIEQQKATSLSFLQAMFVCPVTRCTSSCCGQPLSRLSLREGSLLLPPARLRLSPSPPPPREAVMTVRSCRSLAGSTAPSCQWIRWVDLVSSPVGTYIQRAGQLNYVFTSDLYSGMYNGQRMGSEPSASSSTSRLWPDPGNG